MLQSIIALWKESSVLPLLGTFGKDIQLFMAYFAKEHFANGESDRNAAIDALCEFLQTQKTTSKE